MRYLAIAGALLVSCGAALAQAPQEVAPTDALEVRVQQTRTFRFEFPVNRISLSVDGVAQVIPESDRVMNIRGLAQGQTMLTAYGPDDRVVYRATVSVMQAGGYVKIYGLNDANGKRQKDFSGFYCNDGGCGRADEDVPPKPYSTIFSETIPKPDGGSQTISREYRR